MSGLGRHLKELTWYKHVLDIFLGILDLNMMYRPNLIYLRLSLSS